MTGLLLGALPAALLCWLGALPARSWTSAPRRPRHAVIHAGDSDLLDRFFFDQADVAARSGPGGLGALAFVGQRPAGGSGGMGGSVYLECSAAVNTLGHLRGKCHLRAERGDDGAGRETGSSAKHEVLLVPLNCVVTDMATNKTMGTLRVPGERMLIAEGGEGGLGNGEVWARTRNDGQKRAPPGGAERRKLQLSMTLVADVGLVGYPNAGKSTLLRAVTRAQPKVADYPFTTIIPNLGVCELDRFGLQGMAGMVWLDIPGLIEGANTGRGLGHAFLRHVERCRLVLHLIDGESDTCVSRLCNPAPCDPATLRSYHHRPYIASPRISPARRHTVWRRGPATAQLRTSWP